MSDTNEMSREQELLEEFKAGLDKDGPVVLAQRVAELEADRDRASDAVATVQAERDALLERVPLVVHGDDDIEVESRILIHGIHARKPHGTGALAPLCDG